jgi:hypothetical protein
VVRLNLQPRQRSHMSAEYARARAPFAGVRRTYWIVLALTLVIALFAPVATFWLTASVSLQVQACVFPATPWVGQSAWLLLAPTNPTDRTALAGPWARASAQWDMVAMRMGPLEQTITGSKTSDGTFAIPLDLTMAGDWQAHVALSTPGRPSWEQTLHFTVGPYNPSPSLMPALARPAGCGAGPMVAQGHQPTAAAADGVRASSPGTRAGSAMT